MKTKRTRDGYRALPATRELSLRKQKNTRGGFTPEDLYLNFKLETLTENIQHNV